MDVIIKYIIGGAAAAILIGCGVYLGAMFASKFIKENISLKFTLNVFPEKEEEQKTE